VFARDRRARRPLPRRDAQSHAGGQESADCPCDYSRLKEYIVGDALEKLAADCSSDCPQRRHEDRFAYRDTPQCTPPDSRCRNHANRCTGARRQTYELKSEVRCERAEPGVSDSDDGDRSYAADGSDDTTGHAETGGH